MEQYAFPFRKVLRNQLDGEAQQLIAAAELAADSAYAPYSRFKVGAAAQLADGTVLSGSNHENASYPAGICAEQAVLARLDMRERKEKVVAMAVTYKGGSGLSQPLSPCGICRQTILEVQNWQKSPIKLYMCSPDGQVIMVEDAAFLLPFSFGSEYLDPS